MTPHNPHALPAAFLDQPLAALPEDAADERLPIFTRDRQTAFLQALAACISARRARVARRRHRPAPARARRFR